MKLSNSVLVVICCYSFLNWGGLLVSNVLGGELEIGSTRWWAAFVPTFVDTAVIIVCMITIGLRVTKRIGLREVG